MDEDLQETPDSTGRSVQDAFTWCFELIQRTARARAATLKNSTRTLGGFKASVSHLGGSVLALWRGGRKQVGAWAPSLI